MDLISKIGGVVKSATEGLKIKSVLNPILWLCGIASPTCFISAYYFKEMAILRTILIVIGILPIIIACIMFIYFCFKEPERLQSEEYQIKHETLKIIQSKSENIKINSTSLESIFTKTEQKKKDKKLEEKI